MRIVDEKRVAQDWLSAFGRLQETRSSRIQFNISGGGQITNVSKIDIMPGGYLMLFTIKAPQGSRYEIVKTSEIESISAR